MVVGTHGGSAGGGPGAEERRIQKIALRDQLSTERRRRSLAALVEDAAALAELLVSQPEVRRAATLAAYVSTSHEPGTGPLLDRLRNLGRRVLVPVLRADDDLDWAPYHGPDSLVRARRGLLQPAAPPLGVDAVAGVDAVLVPALAVDRTGMRLGRGGGSYDRALARVPADTWVCALLHEGEVVDEVPADAHDRPVQAAATAAGVTRFAGPG